MSEQNNVQLQSEQDKQPGDPESREKMFKEDIKKLVAHIRKLQLDNDTLSNRIMKIVEAKEEALNEAQVLGHKSKFLEQMLNRILDKLIQRGNYGE